MSCDYRQKQVAGAAPLGGVTGGASQGAYNLAQRVRQTTQAVISTSQISRDTFNRSMLALAGGVNAAERSPMLMKRVNALPGMRGARKVLPWVPTIATSELGVRVLATKAPRAALMWGKVVGKLGGLMAVDAGLWLNRRTLGRWGGQVAEELSQGVKAGEVIIQDKDRLGFEKKPQSVALHNSSLTPWLNRANRLAVGEKVLWDSGVTLKGKKEAWHRGTTVVDLPDGGGRRTISHMQTLNFPARHYFFNRGLSHAETAQIAWGHIKPQAVSGFVGESTPGDSLALVGGVIRRQYLRAKIYSERQPSERIGERNVM